jgi:hypothetical protein
MSDRGRIRRRPRRPRSSARLGSRRTSPDVLRGLDHHPTRRWSIGAGSQCNRQWDTARLAAPMRPRSAIVAGKGAGDAGVGEGAARAGRRRGGHGSSVEKLGLGPGACEQLPEPLRATMIDSAPTFVAQQRDPHVGARGRGRRSAASSAPCCSRRATGALSGFPKSSPSSHEQSTGKSTSTGAPGTPTQHPGERLPHRTTAFLARSAEPTLSTRERPESDQEHRTRSTPCETPPR